MSLEADFIMRKLKALPVTQALKKPSVPLPEAKAPSLEGLVMTVKKPAAPTAEELARRVAERSREQGTRRARSGGETVGLGDELWVDLLCYAGGKLMRGGVKFDYPLDVVDDGMFVGLARQLAGAKLGGWTTCSVMLGPRHPEVAMRGQSIEMQVEIHRAFEVKPAPVNDVKAIEAELAEEAANAAWAAGRRALLDALAERGGAQVSDALVDEELRRAWGAAEGQRLSAMGFGAEQQQEALNAWLQNGAARAEVRSRLKLSLTLRAIAEREQLQPTAEQLQQMMVVLAAPYGVAAEGLDELLRTEPVMGKALADAALEQVLISYVLERAEVRGG